MAIVEGMTVLGVVVLRKVPQVGGRKLDGRGLIRAWRRTGKVMGQGTIVKRAGTDIVYGSLDGKGGG